MGDIRDYEPLFGAWYADGLLGEGFSGKVWRVHRAKDGKIDYSAVKVISIPYSEADLERVYSEMGEHAARGYFRMFVDDVLYSLESAYSLSGNANIVAVEDHQVIKRDFFHWDILIRMELLQTLGEYMTSHPMKTHDIIRLGLDISCALGLLASKHVIHGDIRPDNIFVFENGVFKLDVFGSCMREYDCSAFRKGIRSYTAPEVLRGEKCSSSADMYSLGIVMYRLLNKNRLPFMPPFPEPITASDHEKALSLRMRGEVPLPDIPDIHPALNAFVLKACAYNPEDRFTDASEFRAELEKVIHIMKGE